jgi:hypothetical protein
MDKKIDNELFLENLVGFRTWNSAVTWFQAVSMPLNKFETSWFLELGQPQLILEV